MPSSETGVASTCRKPSDEGHPARQWWSLAENHQGGWAGPPGSRESLPANLL